MDLCSQAQCLIYLPRTLCLRVGGHASTHFTIFPNCIAYVNTCLFNAPMQCVFVAVMNYLLPQMVL